METHVQSSVLPAGDESRDAGADRRCRRCGLGVTVDSMDGGEVVLHCEACLWYHTPSGRTVRWDEVCSAAQCGADRGHKGWREVQDATWARLACRVCGTMHPDHRVALFRRCQELGSCVRCGRELTRPAGVVVGTQDGTRGCEGCALVYSDWQTVEGYLEEGCASCSSVRGFDLVCTDREGSRAVDCVIRRCRGCREVHHRDRQFLVRFRVDVTPSTGPCDRCGHGRVVPVHVLRYGALKAATKCLGCDLVTDKSSGVQSVDSDPSDVCRYCRGSRWALTYLRDGDRRLLMVCCVGCDALRQKDRLLVETRYPHLTRKHASDEPVRVRSKDGAARRASIESEVERRVQERLSRLTLAGVVPSFVSSMPPIVSSPLPTISSPLTAISSPSPTQPPTQPPACLGKLQLGTGVPPPVTSSSPTVTSTQPSTPLTAPDTPPVGRAGGEAGTCVVCLASKSCIVLLDCAHVCMCERCAVGVLGSACPMCRAPVRDARRCYLV
jgi:hypothetical protein